MDNETIKVHGADWCGDSYRAMPLLDKHQIDYQWINIDNDHEAKETVRQVDKGAIVVPTIIFQDGSVLTEPTNNQLRRKIWYRVKKSTR